MFGVLLVAREGLADAHSAVGDGYEDLLAAPPRAADDMVVGLDGGVGPERGGAVFGGVRADFGEDRADSDPLAKAVALVLQDLRDTLDDAGDLLFGVEVDQLVQRPGIVSLSLLQRSHVRV